MSDTTFGPLRIWDGIEPVLARSLDRQTRLSVDSTSTSFIDALALQEVLRPSLHLREPVEPLSLAWYQELEHLRYHRQGRWIPQLLEFDKYSGERLLGMGTSLGSDLVNFAGRDVEVIVASPIAEHLRLVSRNFELRKLPGVFLHAKTTALPIESASIDVVCLTGVLHETSQPAAVVDEIYRVLKPGGKLLAVVPARYEIDAWLAWLRRFRRSRREQQPVFSVFEQGLLARGGKRFERRELTQLFRRFHDGRIYRRHLRRADVPHLCRWLPLGMLERLTGRLLLFKGLKPVSAARFDSAAA